MATNSVDLRELASGRTSREGPRAAGRPRRLISRVVVPGLILLGFAGVLAWSLRATLWPPKSVTVVPVIASRSDMVAADTPLFRAAGWVEPRPQATVVSALTEGIVDEMLVVEGQRVEAGQVVARLVRRDSEIAAARAEADVRLREAEVASAQAALTATQSLFDEPIQLQAALTDADATLAKVETELARLPSLIRAAEAKRAFSEKEVAGKTEVADAVSAISLRRAQSELESAQAQLDEYRQQTKSLERERVALDKRKGVLQRRLELKIDETRELAEAKAALQAAEAQLQQAQAAEDAAQLALERTEVRAKTAGNVLALVAKPGSRMMGLERAATYDASTVITMYDPASLQVRADVRLDDVPRLSVGQKVQIESPAHAQPLSGRVLLVTAITDTQKNTLQVKLAIDEAPAVLKPDMLVQVTFLAPPQPATVGVAPPLRLLAPRELVQGSGGEATVWLADQASGRAILRRVTAGAATADGLVEITSGLNVGDRLIAGGRESLVAGERIQVSGSDQALGRDAAATPASEPAAIKSSDIQRTGAADERN